MKQIYTPVLINGGYISHRTEYKGKYILDHVAIAEKALGKKLPTEAIVHHWDGNKVNNVNSNLVICPNQSYHVLMHKRMEAYLACGNANYRRCLFCKQYDDVSKMYIHVTSYAHRRCHTAQAKRRYTGK
jgi:hypothetical protein